MITRLWFAVSVIWVGLFLCYTYGERNIYSSPWFWVGILWPFAIGLLVRIVSRYVITGSLRRPVALPKRPVHWR
jgi:hypothetical protein